MIIKWRSAAILAAFLTVSGGPAPLLAASGAAAGEFNAATGGTAQAAPAYGEGASDAFAYISRHGGIIALNGARSDDFMRDAMLAAGRAGSREGLAGMRNHAAAEPEGVRLPTTFLGSLSPRHDHDPFSQRVQRRESACAEGLHGDRAGPPGLARLELLEKHHN